MTDIIELNINEDETHISDEIDTPRDMSLETALRDFYVLRGQGASIFDNKRCKFMSASDFKTSFGSKVAGDFLNSEKRKVIYKENLDFAPGKQESRGHINLYRGLPLTPKEGKCERLLQVLFHLCGEDQEVYDWVLKWVSYPLQYPGSKMTTAIVIHGREGAGKNLFWTAIQRIYGDYTSIITQNDLESSFNGWASRKLFIIGNEVVSRQEMYHKKGVMKNMITEPDWNINEKNINQRKESNHANFVFFSNFMQPVSPDRDDRRYLILWTPEKKDKEFYKSAAHERDTGGCEALYHFLLNYDLGDFDEYTEPLMTKAKLELINLSMKSDERFIESWLDGEFPLPLVPVLTADLYREYQHWCKREGEKFYVSMTEFSTLIGKHELISKKSHQRYLKGVREKKGTFAIPFGCEPDDGVSVSKWLSDSVSVFNRDASLWRDDQ